MIEYDGDSGQNDKTREAKSITSIIHSYRYFGSALVRHSANSSKDILKMNHWKICSILRTSASSSSKRQYQDRWFKKTLLIFIAFCERMCQTRRDECYQFYFVDVTIMHTSKQQICATEEFPH